MCALLSLFLRRVIVAIYIINKPSSLPRYSLDTIHHPIYRLVLLLSLFRSSFSSSVRFSLSTGSTRSFAFFRCCSFAFLDFYLRVSSRVRYTCLFVFVFEGQIKERRRRVAFGRRGSCSATLGASRSVDMPPSYLSQAGRERAVSASGTKAQERTGKLET